MCGLRAEKKQGVAGTGITQADYGIVGQGGLPVTTGLMIAGTPVGSSEFVQDSLQKLVQDKVLPAFEAISEIPSVQQQHLLGSQCCGNTQVQNIWQVLNPQDCVAARTTVDYTAFQSIRKTMGLTGTVPDAVVQQIFLPQRFGGLGYRMAGDVYNSAFLGGFALAAYGTVNIGDIYPALLPHITYPETSTLPSMVAVCEAWKLEVNLTTRDLH
jgi:hypothetical protein